MCKRRLKLERVRGRSKGPIWQGDRIRDKQASVPLQALTSTQIACPSSLCLFDSIMCPLKSREAQYPGLSKLIHIWGLSLSAGLIAFST